MEILLKIYNNRLAQALWMALIWFALEVLHAEMIV